MSEEFNQKIIPLNNNFIIAFEEIVIFKFYYQHDNKKTWRTSIGRNEGTNVSVSTTLLSKDKKLPRESRSTTTIPNEAFLGKKKQQEQWRRAEEGTSEEQRKIWENTKKDSNDAFVVFCQFVFFLAYCVLKNGIILKELALLIFRAKPDVGRIREQQQKKTRLDQGKIFIIRNTRTRTHGNLTRIGRTCQTLGKERHNIEFDITRKHQHYKLIKQWMNLEDMPFTLNFLKTTRARKEKNYQKKRARKAKSVRVV